MSLKPICVKCRRFYRVIQNGISFIEGMPNGVVRDAPPGQGADEYWQDYKLWRGDLWQCQGCGHELIAGVGRAPVAEHYQPDFPSIKERFGATLRINDC